MNISIATDTTLLDIDVIHQFLTNSYWAKGRTKAAVIQSIAHSLNFGMYLDGKQIGFARVVTDYTIFGYLMDVFVIEAYRGKGYSKQLLRAIFDHEHLHDVQRWMLGTKDAHGLYQQFGFEALEDPSRIMGMREETTSS